MPFNALPMGGPQESKPFSRILIIDDDRASRYLAHIILQDMAIAQEVHSLPSAGQGMDFIRQYCQNQQAASEVCPDLILLDINMPVMDGFEFLDMLRALGQQNILHTVVVALTSSSYPKDKEKMGVYGVKAFLTKPITEEKIMGLLARSF